MWPDAGETRALLERVERSDLDAAERLWERHRAPARYSSTNGFQPASAPAKALPVSRATSRTIPAMHAAASALSVQAAAGAEPPSASASGSEASVNAGP